DTAFGQFVADGLDVKAIDRAPPPGERQRRVIRARRLCRDHHHVVWPGRSADVGEVRVGVAEVASIRIVGRDVRAVVLTVHLCDEAGAVWKGKGRALERSEVVVEAVVFLDDDHHMANRPNRGRRCRGTRGRGDATVYNESDRGGEGRP